MRVTLGKNKHVEMSARILADEYFDSVAEAKKYLWDKVMSKEFFVVVEDDEVLGVLAYGRDYTHRANYIQDLAVSKNGRRRGVATLLLRKCIEVSKKEQSKKQAYLLSSTAITNTASIRLHLSAGFKKLGEIKGLHYGKDEIIFGYKLW